MRKVFSWLFCLLLPWGSALAGGAEDFHIVTTFAPVYMLTAGVVEGIEGVTLDNMTAPTGHIHDYQLLPADMRKLSEASALVVGGAGLEGFLDKVTGQYADMPIIDSSAGIDLIYEDHEGHAHSETDGHDHDTEALVPNAHLWLDPRLAAQEVRNIGEGLAQADPPRADQYRANAEAYATELEALYVELAQRLEDLSDRRIVTFHNAFVYFAEAFDLEVLASLHLEDEEQVGTRRLAELTDLVRENQVKALFTEPNAEGQTAQIIAAETGATVYELDPLESGALSPEAYEEAMRRNVDTLLEALGT